MVEDKSENASNCEAELHDAQVKLLAQQCVIAEQRLTAAAEGVRQSSAEMKRTFTLSFQRVAEKALNGKRDRDVLAMAATTTGEWIEHALNRYIDARLGEARAREELNRAGEAWRKAAGIRNPFEPK